jgi:four helix bundle protein
MQDFRNLKVWQKGHSLTLEVYKASSGFPKDERFGLTSQIRRSASSIPMNLAEGCGRGSDADFGRFIQIAMGSACELEYQLLLANDLGYFHDSDYTRLHEQVAETKRMLTALIQRLKG